MWFPGSEGGNAAANLLFGKANPSGKVSMSFPKAVGQCPLYYNRNSTGRPRPVPDEIYRGCTCSYGDCGNLALYPFGHGLSYSNFVYESLELDKYIMTEASEITVKVTVKNESNVDGKEVVQLYIKGSGNSVRRRAKELRGYKKIYLAPRQRAEVTFTLGYDELKVYSVNKIYEVEDATVTVMVGSNPNLPLSAEIKTSAEQIPTSI